MARQKQNSHLYFGAGGVLAAVALVTAVAIGITSAEEMHMGSYTPPTTYTAPTTTTTPTYTMPTTCPAGYTGVPPACVASTAPTTTVPTTTDTHGCVPPTYWNGTTCATASIQQPTGGCFDPANVTLFASQECTTARAAQLLQQPQTMPPCPAGVVPSATNPCTPSGTAPTTGTQLPCPVGVQPSATNPCVPSGIGTQLPGTQPTGDCFNSASASYASQECTQARAAKLSTMPLCAAGVQPTAAAPCRPEGQVLPTVPLPPVVDKLPGQEGLSCGQPPFCPFGHKPPVAQPAPGTCPTFECNTPPPGFEKFQMPPGGMGEGQGFPGFPGKGFPGFPGQGFPGQGFPGMPGQQGEGMFPHNPFSQHAEKQTFDKYQLDVGNLEERRDEFQDQYKDKAPELLRKGKELKGEAKRLKQEAAQIESQLESISNRAGVYCPVVAEYSAALNTITTTVAQWEAATTPEEIAAALALREQIYGTPDDPTSGIFRRLHGSFDQDGNRTPGLDEQLGNCEAAGHSFRELDRMIQEGERMLAQAQKDGLDTDNLEALLEELKGYQENPPEGWFDPPDSNKCPFGGQGGPGGPGGFGPPGFGGEGFGPGGPGGFHPPGFGGGGFGHEFEGFGIPEEFQEQFQEGFERYREQFDRFQGSANSALVAQLGRPGPGMDDYEPSEEELACMPGFARVMMQAGRRFGEIMRTIHEGSFEADICGEFENMAEMAEEFEGKVPAACFNKGISFIEKGLDACEAGNPEAARKIMFRMQRLENDPVCRGADFGEDEEGFGVDADDLLEGKFAELEQEIEKRVAAKLEKILDALDEQAKIIVALQEEIAQAYARLAEFGVGIGSSVVKAPAEIRDNIILPLEDIAVVAQERLEALPEEHQEEIAPVIEKLMKEIAEEKPTEARAEVIAQAIDNAITAAAAEEDPEAAKEVVVEAVKELKEQDVLVIAPEERVGTQTQFLDCAEEFGHCTDQWFFPVQEEAQVRGILEGSYEKDELGKVVKDDEGNPLRNAEPGKESNGAEVVVQVARGLGLEPVADAVPAEVEKATGVDLGNAEYAAGWVQALEDAGVKVDEILEKPLDQSPERVEIAELVVAVVANVSPEAVEEPTEEVLAQVEDDSSLAAASAEEREHVAVAIQNGWMLGKGDERGFDGEATIKKVEVAAVVSRAQDSVAALGGKPKSSGPGN